MIYSIIGPPGSGKDTQAELLAEYLPESLVISPGEELRDAVEENHPQGQEIESSLNKGDLVDNKLVFQVIVKRILEAPAQNIIFTGFPRDAAQLPYLEQIEQATGYQLGPAVLLVLSDEQILERLAARLYHPDSGRVYHPKFNPPKVAGVDDETGEKLVTREDDNPEAIKQRIEVFKQNISPLIAFFEDRGLLIKVDGNQPIDDVFSDLVTKINQ